MIAKSNILSEGAPERVEGTPLYAFTPYVYELHGNVRYMHCSDEVKDTWARNFYKAPTLEEATDRTNHVPKCKDCGAPMKPHCMFFDECYTECYYRSDSIRAIEEDKMDALIVVGTALATGGAKRLVMKTLER